ncbi:MAG: glycogen-binding domain-containing protein [Desulfosarcinaceae bacterium]|nr:glycogen-binding domain-containing protein [Desulfosarcinaceae bacterium]
MEMDHDYLASVYIDDEMDLDEKRHFVEKVHTNAGFYAETLELLDQEKLLREMPELPAIAPVTVWQPSLRERLAGLLRPLGFATAGFAAAILVLFTLFQPPAPALCHNRFVLYQPTAARVELTGSFIDWQRVALKPIGSSGYWEVHLRVPAGEHRFAYILDGKRRVADPTIPTSEKDDFGGENSILQVTDLI